MMEKKDYLPRLIDDKIEEYLSVFGAVCVEGPKWCGKRGPHRIIAEAGFLLGIRRGIFKTADWLKCLLRWYWKAKNRV